MKIFILLFILALSILSGASEKHNITDMGNGGHAIVCEAHRSLQLYDLLKAKIVRDGWGLRDFPEKHERLDRWGILRRIVFELRSIDESLSEKVEALVRIFRYEMSFRSGSEMPVTKDHRPIEYSPDIHKYMVEKECKLILLVVQNPHLSINSWYTVNEDYWIEKSSDKEVEIQFAAVILHEVLYRLLLNDWSLPSSEELVPLYIPVRKYYMGYGFLLSKSAEVVEAVTAYIFSQTFQKRMKSIRLNSFDEEYHEQMDLELKKIIDKNYKPVNFH